MFAKKYNIKNEAYGRFEFPAVKQYGSVAIDECLAFVQALVLGGEENISNIKKVKLKSKSHYWQKLSVKIKNELKNNMIIAKRYFEPFKNELPDYRLKFLVNIEDFNNIIFDEVFAVLKPNQQAQYVAYRASEEAEKYRAERNAELPYVDFDNLPEILDEELLEKLLFYDNNCDVRDILDDLLSHEQLTQIAQLNCKKRDEEKARERAMMTDEEKRKEQEWWDNYNADPNPRFFGNIGEPDTVTSYILKYGYNPITLEKETIESFEKKYIIDPKTGNPIPRENKE